MSLPCLQSLAVAACLTRHSLRIHGCCRHFIYRFCVYFAPQSSKDWAKGQKFIEWVVSQEKMEEGERWVLDGLMAIRGSRNGVFWADAIAMICWWQRATEFLQHEKAVAAAKKEREGGRTREYLLAMMSHDVVKACLHAMALLYLEFYVPFMANITHLADAADGLVDLDQTVLTALVDASCDVSSLLSGEQPLLPTAIDHVRLMSDPVCFPC